MSLSEKSRTSSKTLQKEGGTMQQVQKPLTYKQNMSKTEVFHVIKAIGIPLMVFGLGLFTISNFAAFGAKLICPLSGTMWLVGFIVALFMPSQRRETLNQTMVICSIYFLALLGLKILLAVVSGVSSEMIAASYDQAIPTSTGNAIPGYLQSMLWFVAVLLPVGNISMQVKRLFQFKHNQSLHKTFGQKRGIRSNGKSNSTLTQ